MKFIDSFFESANLKLFKVLFRFIVSKLFEFLESLKGLLLVNPFDAPLHSILFYHVLF